MIVVTGGLGYIGAHVVHELLTYSSHDIMIIDDESSACNKEMFKGNKRVLHLKYDIRKELPVFGKGSFEAVIHCAGLAYVDEGEKNPELYTDVNVKGTMNILSWMTKVGITKLVFSSSCSVYGECEFESGIREHQPLNPISTYAKTKALCETFIEDWCHMPSSPPRTAIALRYFNAVGYREGFCERYTDRRFITSMVSRADLGYPLWMNGANHNTPDGTCIRDFTNVMDIALAHIKAIFALEKQSKPFKTYNVGTGKGTSLKNVLNIFKSIIETKKLHYKVKTEYRSKRDGDPAMVFADPELAKRELNWEARYSLEESIQQTIDWISRIRSN